MLLDKVSIKNNIIISFAVTGIAIIILSFISDIQSHFTITTIIFLQLGKYLGTIVIDAMFMKYMRQHARGTLSGFKNLATNVGMLFSSLLIALCVD